MQARQPTTEDSFASPCSFAQQRLWFLDRLAPASSVYNIPAALRLGGRIDKKLLERAVYRLAERHESLRTTFSADQGEPFQWVAAEPCIPVNVSDLRGLPGERRESEALRLAAAEAQVPFDLERGPLLRITILELGENDDVLLVTTHHIISDGWSTEIFFRELAALYEAEMYGVPANLPELAIQYTDYAAWQREWLSAEEAALQIDYWRRKLSGVPLLQLPTDRPRPEIASHRGNRELTHIGSQVTTELKKISLQSCATLFMTLLAAFEILLYRYCGQDDFAVGTLTAGRDRPETEGLIGFFVNTLVLRAKINASSTFRELLSDVRETAIEAYAHSGLPFEKLVEELHPDRDLSRNPFVQVAFQLYNPPKPPGRTRSAAPAQLLDVQKDSAKFDIGVDAWEQDGGLTIRAEYSTDLFEAETLRRMLSHFTVILEGIAADPDRAIGALRLLTEEEYSRQVFQWNRTEQAYPREARVHELFEEQAARTPDSIAVVTARERVTYAGLNDRAERVAGHLRRHNITPETLVAVCLDRHIGLIAALLGVMKAGGAYVPIDPTYPQRRKEFILADSGASFIIQADTGIPESTGSPAQSPAPEAGGRLAYVIYTSGSTGAPKGVAIEHRSASALIHWARNYYAPEELSGVLAATSVCFDLSIFELFATLSCGGTVILADNALHLPTLPAREEITLINTVPSAIAELARMNAIPDSVRTINLAGEPLTSELVDIVFANSHAATVNNLYGPTEDTTYSTVARITRGERWRPTIGRPLDNRKSYILDGNRQPVPAGVTGELYLGGAGVARGYLNRPDLTTEKFIPSPFAPGSRLYRTGDLARYGSDGEIEFLGRADDQVKIHGYRIEPAEVEAALRRCSGLRDAAVAARANAAGERRLIAYVVPEIWFSALDEIRSILERSLPQHMIPSIIVSLDEIPRTPNGKADRAALPEPGPVANVSRALPRTEVERSIAAIWQELLEIQGPGLDDNFFELGGHSLLLLRMQARIQAEIGNVSVVDLFRYPTIRAMAAHLADARGERRDWFAAAQQRAERQRERVKAKEKPLSS
jgi:amino acid adenylation domain-containing protein